MPRIPIEHVVDTTGAGDSFAAGLAFGYLQDADIVRAAQYGNAMGAQRCTGSTLDVYLVAADQQTARRHLRHRLRGLTSHVSARTRHRGEVTVSDGPGGDMATDAWVVEESRFDPKRANFYETLFTVGNGRLGTWGSLEEGHRGQLSGRTSTASTTATTSR